jgi:hypothetical protein
MAQGSPSTFYARPSNDTWYFWSLCFHPSPVDSNGCRGKRGSGPWTGTERHNDCIRQSLWDVSFNRTLETTARRDSTSSTNESFNIPVAKILRNKLVLAYPGHPTQCPRCPWRTHASGCSAMNSMFRHMETRHGMRMEKWWECSLCGFEDEGIVLIV